MKSEKTTFSSWLTDNCYIIFSVLAFLTFYYDIPQIIRPVVFLMLVILNVKYIRMGGINSIVLFFIISAFLSLTGNLIRPYPISFFLTDLYWAYLPIIFFFIGLHSSDDYPAFYNRSLWAFMFIFIVGFYFLLFPTEKYITKTLEILNLHSEYNEGTYMYARFASFLDSYHTANLGVCSLCFSFGLLKVDSKNKIFLKVFAYIGIAVSLLTIILAQQRVAMFIGFLLLLYFFFLSKNGKLSGIVVIAAVCVIGLLFMTFINYYLDDAFTQDLLEQLTGRYSSESGSVIISGRSSQWKEAIDGFFMEPLLGLGIGSGGHLAIEKGITPAVADGSYFKILLEGGIVSFIPFMVILVSSLVKSLKQRDRYYVEGPLLLFFACSMIGANIIDMPYIIMFMWYILGRINRIEKKSYIIRN